MRAELFIFLVAFGQLCSAVAAQEQLDQRSRNAKAAANSQVANEKKGIEDEIIALEKRLWNGDANEVSKLEAEDYEVIKHAHRYHRADDEAAAKDVKFALVSMDDIRVRMLRSDVALLTYHATEEQKCPLRSISPRYGSTGVGRNSCAIPTSGRR